MDCYPKDLTEDIYKTEQRNDFHVKQCYDKETCETVICTKCGGDKFQVGHGDWYTAIKCVTCKWEICIHDG